jgi:hypothetical protein
MDKFRLLVLTRLLSILTIAATTAIVATAAKAATPAQASQPAVWTPHDIIVSFDHLPKVYSCDDLWYKIRDVLVAIGARPDLRILTYQCGASLGTLARSPQVHLHFSLPQAIARTQARWADMETTAQTVRLGPGHPASLTDSDCELMRQMKDDLLAALPDRVLTFNLACAGPATHWPFSVSVEILAPVAGRARVAAQSDRAPTPLDTAPRTSS